MKGDCLSCSRLSNCSETDVRKVIEAYTCLRYDAVEEPVFKAREDSIERFGLEQAISAMLESKGDTK